MTTDTVTDANSGASTRIAAIVLAAGESRRFASKQSKLLAQLPGELTVVEKTLHALSNFAKNDIAVVTGRYHQQLQALLPGFNCINNPEYAEGLSRSIRCGLQWAEESGQNYGAALVVLADQVALQHKHIDALVKQFHQHCNPNQGAGKLAAASRFGPAVTPGPPAIFSRSLFAGLKALQGDRGARPLLQKLRESGQLYELDLPEAGIDIDTRDDLQRYRNDA